MKYNFQVNTLKLNENKEFFFFLKKVYWYLFTWKIQSKKWPDKSEYDLNYGSYTAVSLN